MDFKRGDTFLHFGLLPPEFSTGTWTALCVLKDIQGNGYPVTATVETPVAPETRRGLTLKQVPALTAGWPLGKMKGEVQFTDSSVTPPYVVSSKTFSFKVVTDLVL